MKNGKIAIKASKMKGKIMSVHRGLPMVDVPPAKPRTCPKCGETKPRRQFLSNVNRSKNCRACIRAE